LVEMENNCNKIEKLKQKICILETEVKR